MRRLARVAVVVVLVAGCAKSGLSREELETRYIDGLVEAGIDEPTATCVMDRFFESFTDAELKRFNTSGESLTDAQQQRIDELTTECTSA